MSDPEDFLIQVGALSIYILFIGFIIIQVLLLFKQVTIDEAITLQTSYASILGPIIAPILAYFFKEDD